MNHRHSPPGQHEHDFEPTPGLPEALPRGETLLWQGRPDWKDLARRVFHVRKLAVYFALILALRATYGWSQGDAPSAIAMALVMLLPLVLLALGLMLLFAWLYGRTTVYSITNKRVVMRIGIVLSMTLNLPFTRISAADLRRNPTGLGDIPIRLMKGDKIAFLHLWPHARPWRLAEPEPMLRSLPDAAHAAQVLVDAWSAAHGRLAPGPLAAAPQAAEAQQPGRAHEQQPAWASS